MAEWHRAELLNALNAKGWRLVRDLPGDSYRITDTWEIERSTRDGPSFLDFDGMDGMGELLPKERSFGCEIRGRTGQGLYFYKSRRAWTKALDAFVRELDSPSSER